MGVDFNVNEEVNKNKSSRYFFLAIVVIALVVLVILALNGKHNKLPGGIETNIPADSVKKDTVSVYNDNHKEVNIKTNNAPIILK